MLTTVDGAGGTRFPSPAESINLLIAGRIGLHEVAPIVFETYSVAFEDGRASRDPEVAELRAELERLALHAFDPGRQRRTVEGLLERERVQRVRKGAA